MGSVVATTLLVAGACTSSVAGSGGIGGAASSSQGSETSQQSSTGMTVGDCFMPTSVVVAVKLPDGTDLPSNASAPPSSTTLTGILHLTAAGYSVTGQGGEVINVEHDALTNGALGLSEGMSVTIFVGYLSGFVTGQTAGVQAYSLRVELTDDNGDLYYFAAVGDDTLKPPGGRVGVGYGAIVCSDGQQSGTGGPIQRAVHDIEVQIDGAELGTFKMGMPATKSVGGKSFLVDDRNSMAIYYADAFSLAVLGRAVP